MNHLRFITIVMPVFNEEECIADIVNDLLIQDYPRDLFEIIVADGGSTDRTREVVRKLSLSNPRVILTDNPRQLPSSGRNVGFRIGKGDYFLVIDGHCRIENDQLLQNLAACFAKTDADCLCRPQPLIVPDRPTTQKAIALARSSFLGHNFNSYIYSNKEGWVTPVSVGCAYRREVFEKIGYFDESFDACEDVEFNYRIEKAGLKSFLTPAISVSYYPRRTLASLWRQMIRYSEGRVKFLCKYPESINLDIILPLLFLLGLTGGLVLGIFNTYVIHIYLVTVGAYLALILFEAARKCARSGLLFLKIIAAFLVIHLAWEIGIVHFLLKCHRVKT